MKPVVSIIMATYNRAYLIEETLASIQNQTFQNWECLIIVDDGSTDNTDEVIGEYVKKDSRFQYHKRPETHKPGGNGARNYGFEVSKGEYIQWFDSDDIMGCDFLKDRVNFILENNMYDFIVHSMGYYTNGKFKLDDKRKIINANNKETIREFLIGGKFPWNICRPFFKREIIENLTFNENLYRFQDVEYNIRLLKLYKPSYISIDKTDCYYRTDEIPERFKSKQSSNRLFLSLYEFYNSIFNILSEEELEEFKFSLINKLYSIIKLYQRPLVDIKIVLMTIKLFNKKFHFNITTKVKFISIVYINKLFYGQKGHYKLIKLIDRIQ